MSQQPPALTPSLPIRHVTRSEEWWQESRASLVEFEQILAETGIERGLIGPREVPRLWDRHLENSAVVADPSLDLVPEGARVVDLGTGAGFPGLVWALIRPDLRLVLVDPLQRRTVFLTEMCERFELGDRVTVLRGRAQEVPPQQADVVTSRALASLEQVVQLSIPHLHPEGRIVALKGGKAPAEVIAAYGLLLRERLRPDIIRIEPIGSDGHPKATVVKLERVAKNVGAPGS